MLNYGRSSIDSDLYWAKFYNKLVQKRLGGFILSEIKSISIVLLLIILVIILSFFATYYHYIFISVDVGAEQQISGSANSDAQYVYWVQAFYALLSVLVTGLLGLVANKINSRQRLEAALNERILFEKFTGDRIFWAKKAINNPRFRKYLQLDLPKKIFLLESSENTSDLEWQNCLDDVKDEMDDLLKSIKCSFFNECLSTDHIEYMMNEYISMSKLIIDDVIDIRKSTRLGYSNFIKVYDRMESYIYLRRKLSSQYAKEYQVVVAVLER